VSVTPFRLWSDEPSAVDLLAFRAVADTAVEAVLDDSLDPVALGVSGSWGSGKSTVLQLIGGDLEERYSEGTERVLVVHSDPWRYDPSVGAKAALIGEVLAALQHELADKDGGSETAKKLLSRLAKRVNWVKALKVAARTSITLQLPSIDDLSSLINEESSDSDEEPNAKTLDEFRDEFAELLADDGLSEIKRVVVLVDDLDRCLPETVVETLETMRLFLSVPKMSFVIAADEDRVADALRSRYPKGPTTDLEEEPAKLYLHKIVQTTLRLPALSRFDTEAYLLLLQLQVRPPTDVSEKAFAGILEGCTELRMRAGSLDDLELPDGVDIATERQFAARLTPMLYEKLRGSPRRIKRFLNDLNVRRSVARRRGIELEDAVVAKLMVLELLLPDEFTRVLEWLASGELREQLSELERRAGQVSEQTGDAPVDTNSEADGKAEPSDDTEQSAPEDAEEFSDNFVRWAKLPPPLAHIDLSPYLHLAASFGATPLIDIGLPERLRDIAANLLSSSRIEQKAVTDADLRGLGAEDAATLVEHLGRIARDRPVEMSRAVGGVLRVTSVVPTATAQAEKALKALPVGEIRPPVILRFNAAQVAAFDSVLSDWDERTSEQSVKVAIAQVRQQGAS
jgi:hypothetical protein